MNSIDLTPLYRNSVGYDRLGSMLDSALRGSDHSANYPPYDIEMLDEDRYTITLALAGFGREDLDINVENSVLCIRGQRDAAQQERRFLHQGIAYRPFERRFNLAEYVEVTGAEFREGLLTISLKREIPEAMKPRTIPIDGQDSVLEHDADSANEESSREAA
ncbi:MAG: Hsp20 family protein [Halioglobus sp.]